jgi:hypothetical protein
VQISRLPELRLLDAAHIMMDAEQQLGQPVVTNGLPPENSPRRLRCQFDRHRHGFPYPPLRGAARTLELHEGTFLELGLQAMAGALIQLPRRTKDYPDRERLTLRFEEVEEIGIGINRSRQNPPAGAKSWRPFNDPLAYQTRTLDWPWSCPSIAMCACENLSDHPGD